MSNHLSEVILLSRDPVIMKSRLRLDLEKLPRNDPGLIWHRLILKETNCIAS